MSIAPSIQVTEDGQAFRAAPEARPDDRFATLDELVAGARDAIADDGLWDFLEGGAGDEQTLADNRAAFARLRLRPRLMSGIGVPSLETTFFGIELGVPILTSPFGAEGQFHPEGHLAVARANAVAGAASIVPEASTFSLEDIAAAAPRAARIMQLHPMGSERTVAWMIGRAAAAGYGAICFTCDCPTAGWRERNLRNRFDVDLAAVSGNYPPDGEVGLEEVFGQLFRRDEPIWTWERLAAVAAEGGLPWMAKGVLTAEDALAAAHAGARAVLVSNHGGRQLDGAPASLSQLPEIARALEGGAVEIALDSGVRRGADVIKALALGADAVVVGRLAAYALAAGGERGVARMHELLREEMITIMSLVGRERIADLDRSMLQAP
jgi:4-hydroxymandelate oxidase